MNCPSSPSFARTSFDSLFFHYNSSVTSSSFSFCCLHAINQAPVARTVSQASLPVVSFLSSLVDKQPGRVTT